MLFDWLVIGQIVPASPASSVRGPKYVVKKGKTPVLTAAEARLLLDSIVGLARTSETDDEEKVETTDVVRLRDRALIGVMVYSFARVSAVIHMRVRDYFPNGKRYWLRLHEKGGKYHEVPCHHNAEKYLDAYLAAAGIADQKDSPLFRTAFGKTKRLTDHPMARQNVLAMIKRRGKKIGLREDVCCHTFRATGITAYLDNGAQLNTPSRSPPTSPPAPRSSTTGPPTR